MGVMLSKFHVCGMMLFNVVHNIEICESRMSCVFEVHDLWILC